ncbi:MAG TPA: type VI secretion system baseplate subunit TssG [Sandaracinaceae bacterium LLY-WYZ-13_1]|nr:type VI secretion system baseplate subunit TssG [Sandaracinaceae bacterium LLY-WYZ-13_1]
MSADGAAPTDEEAREEPPDSQAPPPPLAALMKKAAPVLEAAPRSTFFHVVALLERLSTEAVRIGGEGPPSGERIRFRHDYELGFSAGDISRVRVTELPRGPERSLDPPTPVFEVTTTFLGLTGTVSPLPLYIAEEILHEGDDNPVRRDFLDIFHHRLISLLYRAVSKYMPAREHLTHRTDAWMNRALFLTGLDPEIQTRGLRIHPSVLVRLAPLLAGRGRGPRVLALALREALGEALEPDGTVRIRQFAGGWIEVDGAQRMALGDANCVLGVEAILGKRAYDQSGRFSIELGPLHRDNYRRFLRDGDLLPVVKDVVELCSKEALDFDVELHLAADAVPSFTLSATDGGSELGRDTRLRGAETSAEVMTIPDVGNMRFGDDAGEGAEPAAAAE